MGLKYCVMLASFCGVQHELLMSKLDFWMQVCIKAWCSRLGRDHPWIVVQFDFCCLSGNRFHCPWWPICALNLYPPCSTKEHCSTWTLNWDAEKGKNWFNAFTNMVLLQPLPLHWVVSSVIPHGHQLLVPCNMIAELALLELAKLVTKCVCVMLEQRRFHILISEWHLPIKERSFLLLCLYNWCRVSSDLQMLGKFWAPEKVWELSGNFSF